MSANSAPVQGAPAYAELARLLHEALAQADALDLPLVAGTICQALDRLTLLEHDRSTLE